MFRLHTYSEGGIEARLQKVMPKSLRYRQWKTPKQSGERARLKIVHGPDSGAVFVSLTDRFTVGRGEENDVVIADLRASRRHAEIHRLPSGEWHLRDLGSQNGFVWNARITREAALRAGDIVTLGETAFEFVPDGCDARLLHSPPRALAMDFLVGKGGGTATSLPAPRAVSLPRPVAAAAPDMSGLAGVAGIGATGTDSGGSEKRKKILYAAVIGMGIWMFFDDAPPKKTPSAKDAKKMAKKESSESAERDLASYLPPMPVGGAGAASETFFQEGFREFREKNYLRARIQFETALQINPAHGLAKTYLRQSDQAIDREVEEHLDRGRRDLDAGKLKSARAHFEAVLRLLSRTPDNPSFIEAKDQVKEVDFKNRKGGFDS